MKSKFLKKKPKLNICYFSCMHDRPELTALFISNVARLRERFQSEANIYMVAAITKGDKATLAAADNAPKYTVGEAEDGSPVNWFNYQEAPNNPVGNKWNAALTMAVTAFGNVDYYVKADDDGLLTDAGMRELINAMRDGHEYIGFPAEIYLEPARAEASYFQYPIPRKVMGTLKAYSHSALNKAAIEVHVQFIQRVATELIYAEPGDVRRIKLATAEFLVEHGYAAFVNDKHGAPRLRVNLWEREWDKNLDWSSDLRLGLCGVFAHCLSTEKPALINVKLPGKNIWEYDFRASESQPYSYADLLDLLPDEQANDLEWMKDGHVVVKPGPSINL